MRKQQRRHPHPRRNINRCWLPTAGDYYTRKGLDDAQRELVTFCLILAQGGCENQLRGHTAGNIGVGNDADKLYAAVEQCMPYIGYPRSLNAMNIIDEVTKS
ncbi:MAG: carboxymuconolactone decarboxylase family protein [Merdibacter sp.]